MKAHFRDNAQKSEVHRAHRSRAETVLRLAQLPIVWLHQLRTRHELSQLDSCQLRAVGLDEQLLRRESSKPSWQE